MPIEWQLLILQIHLEGGGGGWCFEMKWRAIETKVSVYVYNNLIYTNGTPFIC